LQPPVRNSSGFWVCGCASVCFRLPSQERSADTQGAVRESTSVRQATVFIPTTKRWAQRHSDPPALPGLGTCGPPARVPAQLAPSDCSSAISGQAAVHETPTGPPGAGGPSPPASRQSPAGFPAIPLAAKAAEWCASQHRKRTPGGKAWVLCALQVWPLLASARSGGVGRRHGGPAAAGRPGQTRRYCACSREAH
jgi:hypothetical protein